MHLVNIFEKIIWWSKMFLSMRSSKYHLMVISSLKKYLRLVFTPLNSFIQWVYLIWWVISKMMMKNLDDQSWNHHNKYKINRKHRKWLKRMHFVDVKKVYFHKIVLDEWKWMNFMDFNQLHSFLIFIQFEWILWKLMNWSKLNDQRNFHIQLIRVSIFSDFNTHFHYKQ